MENEWKAKVLVVLISGFPSHITEFRRKCNEVGMYWSAVREMKREGEHFRVALELAEDRRRIGTKSVGMGWKTRMESMYS